MDINSGFSIKPLTLNNWDDLVTLFGPHGATGGCWCMWFRLSQSQFNQQKGDGNKQALHQLVACGEMPGLLAYDGNEPVGWCSIAPRTQFSRLDRSRVLKRVDDEPVWSIVCFFVKKAYRRKGMMLLLINSAVAYAKEHGAKIIEGYPLDPKKDSTPDVFAYHGLVSAFIQAGFSEVVRRSETRPIMRYFVPEV